MQSYCVQELYKNWDPRHFCRLLIHEYPSRSGVSLSLPNRLSIKQVFLIGKLFGLHINGRGGCYALPGRRSSTLR